MSDKTARFAPNPSIMMLPLLLLFGIFLHTNAAEKDYFTAAVFEHRPRANISDKTTAQVISTNLRFYERAALAAALEGADIIVFSEFGLYPYEAKRDVLQKYAEYVPNPKAGVFNPCLLKTLDRPILHTLSCLARENRMYVVGNTGDVQKCDGSCDADQIHGCGPKCPDDGVLLYNTNVAFDREGNLIARYHKMHPYFELNNIEEETEFVTFKTEFGTFGLIVCFDSVFEESFKLAHEHGIDTMIFPTYWFDNILPFNGVEWQQSWAIANGVNFIAANSHTAGSGTLGSGIYSKDEGAQVYTYDPDGNSKLIMANLRVGKSAAKIPHRSSITTITEYGAVEKTLETGAKFPAQCYDKNDKHLVSLSERGADVFEEYKCFTSQLEDYTVVRLDKPTGHAQACQNGFCCSVTYSAEDMSEKFYLAVFNGTNHVNNHYHWWEEVCMLVRGDSQEGKECFLLPSRSKTVFKSVELRAHFDAKAVYPTVSKDKYRLAPKYEWNFINGDAETVLKFQSESSEPLLKVGLLGRSYHRDPPFNPYFKF